MSPLSFVQRFASICMLTAPIAPVSANDLPPASAFFEAALCQPPYSFDHATALYKAAEKIAKADVSLSGALYHLPAPITRDGFTARAVIFSALTVGVLVDGKVAEELAQRYRLTPEKGRLLGASTKGFARLLHDDQQNFKELGLISIVAREGPALGAKTLLACEVVSEADRKGMEALERSIERK